MKINKKDSAMYKNSVNTVLIVFCTLTLIPEWMVEENNLPVPATVQLNDC